MFVRVKRSGSGTRPHEYLQIVESIRTGDRVRQHVIATLGRRDRLVADGALDALLQSLAKFSEKLRVVERVRTGGIEAHQARSWGPALVFERLWQAQRLPEVLGVLSQGRRFAFDLEGRTVNLAPQQGIVVPRGVMHRTRAPKRTVVLMVEAATVVPTGD